MTIQIEQEFAIKLANDCITEVPVIVLGSGASCAYGIRGMGPLASYLIANIEPRQEDVETWAKFKTELEDNRDLEEALQKVSVTDELLCQIIKHTQRMIIEDELPIFHRLIAGESTLGLSHLYRHLLQTTHKVVNVITTNYDRLAEYAAYHAKIRCNTGFTDGNIRHFSCNKSDPSHYTRHLPFRCIDIWKVHGSVDWFTDSMSRPVGLHETSNVPEAFRPLIVTPGSSKYSATHQEPFRSVISCADQALVSARGFLCVGYGFSDSHIEPKLIHRTVEFSSPVVILARTLRPGAMLFLQKHMHSKVVAFERAEGGTRAYTMRNKDGFLIENKNLWDLEELLKTVGVT